MEKKKSNGLVVAFIIVLILAVFGIGGTLYFYNKSMNTSSKECDTQKCKTESSSNVNESSEEKNSNDNIIEEKNNSNNGLNELKKIDPFDIGYDELGILIYMEDKLEYLPNREKSFSVNDLSDYEIGMTAWKYVVNSSGGFRTEPSLDKSQVDNFIAQYLGLQNYKIKTFKIGEVEDGNIFGLEEKNQKYVASVVPTEYDFPSYRAKSTSYDANTKEIKVNFDKVSGAYSIYKTKEGSAIFKVTQNQLQSIFTLLRVEYN